MGTIEDLTETSYSLLVSVSRVEPESDKNVSKPNEDFRENLNYEGEALNGDSLKTCKVSSKIWLKLNLSKVVPR